MQPTSPLTDRHDQDSSTCRSGGCSFGGGAAGTTPGACSTDDAAFPAGPGRGSHNRKPGHQREHLGVGGRPWTQLHARLQRSLQQSKVLDTESVLVAVSGGQDSVCLLQALVDLQHRWRWRLGVVHCDHGWRPDSAANADFVRGLAARLGLPCYVHAAAPGTVRSERSAREWRYGVFAAVAAAEGYRTVVTAHTATDRAETLMLNLLRGAGPDGLVALSRLRPLVPGQDPDASSETGAGYPGELAGQPQWLGPGGAARGRQPVMLARPLLEFTREETRGFVQRLGLPHYHDTTNDCNDIRRNRLRNEVMPLLRQRFNPRLDAALFRFMEVLDAEMELMDALTRMTYTVVLAREAPVVAAGNPTAAGARPDLGVVDGRAGGVGAGTGAPLSSPPGASAGLRDGSGGGAGTTAAREFAGREHMTFYGHVLAPLNAMLAAAAPASTMPEGSNSGQGEEQPPGPYAALDIAALRQLPLGLQRRVVHRWLRAAAAQRQEAAAESRAAAATAAAADAHGGDLEPASGAGGRRHRNSCTEVGFQDVANCLELLYAPNRSNSDSLCGGLVASVRDGKLLVKTAAEWEAERRREGEARVRARQAEPTARPARGDAGAAGDGPACGFGDADAGQARPEGGLGLAEDGIEVSEKVAPPQEGFRRQEMARRRRRGSAKCLYPSRQAARSNRYRQQPSVQPVLVITNGCKASGAQRSGEATCADDAKAHSSPRIVVHSEDGTREASPAAGPSSWDLVRDQGEEVPWRESQVERPRVHVRPDDVRALSKAKAGVAVPVAAGFVIDERV